jgi:hypothetical protein
MNLLDLARSAVPANQQTLSVNDAPARHWLIRRADGALLEVIFADVLVLADVRAVYPDAAELVRQDDEPRRTATPAEADELRALLGAILSGAAAAEHAEALAIALAAPDAALASFRALTAGR